MTQAAIENLLREKIGLDAITIGSNTIARVIRQRMTDCGLTDMNIYLARLQTSDRELEELIEAAIVPETWFFRDREPFVFLSRYAIAEWLPTHANGKLRILSIPCSTGEEPYSMAIALMEAGLSTKNFAIDAVDISKKSLLKAQEAVYSKNSFRGADLAFRERYFTQIGNEYQLSSSITSIVNFIHGNLLDRNFLLDKIPYDIIFCRNVLIYFDRQAREQTIAVLDRLLTDKGLLFVGHSETGQILTPRFVSVQHPLAFAYRKREAISQELRNTNKSGIKNQQLEKKEGLLKTQDKHGATTPTKLKTQNFDRLPTDNLEAARKLADGGNLAEAAILCQTYLSQNSTSPEAYFLLGQVHQAAGNEKQAEQCFQKATYLQPNHYEALIHLALLKEQRGDTASAAVIRQRIQRLNKI